ncbi:MAG: pirin family protein [Cyanobacteria bacterium P01_F01_bin.3]
MLAIRKAEDRGVSKFNWLDSQHTFSFGGYRDPKNMGFSDLRVINEDRVTPGAGFGTHGHRDMEIISYVIEGELGHRDSMGNGSVIRPGDVQRMSAGTGIMHSEMNASEDNPVHFLQIWILPEEKGIEPGYEQKYFAPDTRQDQWRLVGSHDGRDGSITIHQDVNLYAATLGQGKRLTYDLPANRKAWLQIVKGSLQLDGQTLNAGDGIAFANLDAFSVVGSADNTEVLLFDLAE